MRNSRFALLAIVFLSFIFITSFPGTGHAADDRFFDLRVGGKFIPALFQHDMFLPSVAANLGPFGLDVAGNVTAFYLDENYTLGSTQYTAQGSGFIDYYSAHLKYVLPSNGGVEPSFGVGVFGTGTSGAVNISEGGGGGNLTSNLYTRLGGFDFLFGVDFSLRRFGIPLVLSGGFNHYNYNTLIINASAQNGFSAEIEENINYYLSFFHYFFGISYEF